MSTALTYPVHIWFYNPATRIGMAVREDDEQQTLVVFNSNHDEMIVAHRPLDGYRLGPTEGWGGAPRAAGMALVRVAPRQLVAKNMRSAA